MEDDKDSIHYLQNWWKKKSQSESCSVMSNFLQPHGYTVHGILQARILEPVAFPFSRGSSQRRDQTQVSDIPGGFFTNWALREADQMPTCISKKSRQEIFKGLKTTSLRYHGIFGIKFFHLSLNN